MRACHRTDFCGGIQAYGGGLNMRFVTGGAYQGKAETACKLFGVKSDDIINGSDCDME